MVLSRRKVFLFFFSMPVFNYIDYPTVNVTVKVAQNLSSLMPYDRYKIKLMNIIFIFIYS